MKLNIENRNKDLCDHPMPDVWWSKEDSLMIYRDEMSAAIYRKLLKTAGISFKQYGLGGIYQTVSVWNTTSAV